MVLGILTAVAACPAIIGTTEAVRHGQRQNAREQHRGRKSNLTITLPCRNSYSKLFDNAMIVLKDNKLYVDTEHTRLGANLSHPFSGYYLPYPGKEIEWKKAGFRNGEGMVTTISEDPPFLNWVYVDRNTYEVKYGVRADAEPNFVGPWDCTSVDRRLTFEGWEGFVIVEEEEDSGFWSLYFDRDDDGLRDGGRIGIYGKRMLAVEIWRKERLKTKLASDEERIDRIRDQAEKERKRVQAELEQKDNTPYVPGEGEEQAGQSPDAQSSTHDIELEGREGSDSGGGNKGPESEDDSDQDEILSRTIERSLSQSLDSLHIGNIPRTSNAQTTMTGSETNTGAGWESSQYTSSSTFSRQTSSQHSSVFEMTSESRMS